MCHKSSIFLAPSARGFRLYGAPLPLWRKRHLPRIGGVCLAEGGKKKEPRGALFLHQCAKTAFFIFLYTSSDASGRARPAAV